MTPTWALALLAFGALLGWFATREQAKADAEREAQEDGRWPHEIHDPLSHVRPLFEPYDWSRDAD